MGVVQLGVAPTVARATPEAVEVLLEEALVGRADALMAKLEPHKEMVLMEVDISVWPMETVASSFVEMPPSLPVLELGLSASLDPSASKQWKVAVRMAAVKQTQFSYPRPASWTFVAS